MEFPGVPGTHNVIAAQSTQAEGSSGVMINSRHCADLIAPSGYGQTPGSASDWCYLTVDKII